MKQIQWAVINIYEDVNLNKQVREQIESRFELGWELDKWEFVERGVDNENRRVVTIILCVTRELPDEPAVAVKRGRPAKEAEPA